MFNYINDEEIYGSEIFAFNIVDAWDPDNKVYIKDKFDLYMSIDEEIEESEFFYEDEEGNECVITCDDITLDIPEIKFGLEKIDIIEDFGYSQFIGRRNGRTNEELIQILNAMGWVEAKLLYSEYRDNENEGK